MENTSKGSNLFNPIFLLVVTATIFLAPCSRQDDRIDLLGGLPPQLVTLLTEADDSSLTFYARDTGLETFIDANKHFETLIQNMSEQNYIRHSDPIYNLQKRLTTVLAEEFNNEFYLNDLEFIMSFPPGERIQLMNMRSDMWATAADNNLTRETRIDSLNNYYNVMKELEDSLGMGIAKMTLSELYGALGDKKKEKQYIIEANEYFAGIGMHRLTCQSFGNIGSIYSEEGKVDSMEMCYQTARDLAIRAQLSDQISRFSYFYAMRYARIGRLALANDLINEAIDLCKENKGGYYEIRFIFHAMEFYADYSCWETVERLLSRARILEKKYDDVRDSALFASGSKFIEARLNMARGNVEKANSLFRETEKQNNSVPRLVNPDNILLNWSKGLLDNGFADEAIEIIDRGLDNSRQRSLPRAEARYLVLKAAAEFERGNIDGARRAIDQFDGISHRVSSPLWRDGIRKDILCARIAIAESDTAKALEFVEEGLGRLRSFLGMMDISVQGYLWINDCRELRTLMHELTAHEPMLGYGAELLWRSLALDIGMRQRDTNTSSAQDSEALSGSGMAASNHPDVHLIEECSSLAEEAVSNLSDLDEVHFVYVADNDKITRFIASSDGVERATIPQTAEELQNLIIETSKVMSGDAPTGNLADSIDVYDNLARLGRYLLPQDLHAYSRPGNPRTLLISADDFLGCIPFETFDISNNKEYRSLLEDFDIAYFRHFKARNTSKAFSDPGIIIVNSDFAKSSRYRYPFSSKLRHVQSEGQAVAALDIDAILLEGPKATKQEIKKRWEKASYLYFATHIIRDPEIPYLVLIPVAAPEGDSSPESNYLDFTDIRSADFSNCSIVVLSGCSSGVPSVTTRKIGPSLGDAFLDAGADVVISTFWDVKDDDARKLMTTYTHELDSNGHSHIKALCNARRKLFIENQDSSISFSWSESMGRAPTRMLRRLLRS